MGSPLHPLMREVSHLPKKDIAPATVDRLFDAVQSGGVTPIEAQALRRVLDAHRDDWSAESRANFEAKLGSLVLGTDTVRVSSSKSALPEDLSAEVKTFLIQGPNDLTEQAFVEDLLALAPTYGYTVTLQVAHERVVPDLADRLRVALGMTPEELDSVLDIVVTEALTYADMMPWGEDNKILTGDRMLVPPVLSETTLRKAMRFTQDEGYHAFVSGSFQGAVSKNSESKVAQLLAKELSLPVRETKFYLEGGNLLSGSLVDGSGYGVIGRDTLVISAFHLDENNAFTQAKVSAQKAKTVPSEQDLASTMNNLRRVHEAENDAVSSDAGLRSEAEDFLAKLQLTKSLIAKDLGIAPDKLVEIAQPEFHIDMNLRPLGPGEVMVHHPRQALELLDEALQDPYATDWQLQELQEMRDSAEQELETLGPVCDEIVAQLEAAGLLVVPVGGVFASKQRQANFMNAVPGTTDDGRTFYLTTGSTLSPLERAFERTIKSLGVSDVEFLAKFGGTRDVLSPGERSIQDKGALDCREVHHREKLAGTHDVLSDWIATR
jgi:hypothetical protein